MCTPSAVIAGVGLVSSMLSTASTIQRQAQAGKQSQAAAEYSSAISRRDAELAGIKSSDALAQGQKDQEKARRESQARVGQMATKFGAGNIALDSGSALDLLADTSQLGELDALDIGANAQRQSHDYLRMAGDTSNQSLISEQKGKDSMDNAMLKAGSTLFDAGGSLLKGPNFF